MKKFINKHPWMFVLLVVPVAAGVAHAAIKGLVEIAKPS